jgi:nucleoside-diphosphate-sugar epimerase
LSETAKDIDNYREVNTEGTRRLLCAAKEANVDRFIFFSSVKAVSDEVDQPIDETVTKAPDTPYGQSKLDAEKLVLQGGYVPLPVVLRPCMVYGSTHKGNLPRMIKAVKKGLFPPLPEVQNHRSMVHVEDLVTAAILAAESSKSPHNIYNVADANPYSTRQIYDWIRESAGKPPSSFYIPLPALRVIAFAGDIISRISGRRFLFDSAAMQKLVGSSWYSSAKIENELGFKATYDLQQSLPAIVRFLDRS